MVDVVIYHHVQQEDLLFQCVPESVELDLNVLTVDAAHFQDAQVD